MPAPLLPPPPLEITCGCLRVTTDVKTGKHRVEVNGQEVSWRFLEVRLDGYDGVKIHLEFLPR